MKSKPYITIYDLYIFIERIISIMNRQVLLCRSILENPSITQRELADQFFLSLGTVNHLVKECTDLCLLPLKRRKAFWKSRGSE